VPEKAGDLDVVVLAAIEMAHQRADEDHGEVDDASEDVATVEARDEVERVRVRGVPEDEPFFDETGPADAEVLLVLTGQEERAAGNGEAEKEQHLLAFILDGSGVREHHRDARADEKERQRRGEVDAELRLAGVMPHRARAAKNAVGEKKASERQRVRAKKKPHSDFAERRAAEVDVGRPFLGAVIVMTVPAVPVSTGTGMMCRRSAAVLRCGFLRGDSRCAHGPVFPWVLSRYEPSR
jgi:hypothetical protein